MIVLPDQDLVVQLVEEQVHQIEGLEVLLGGGPEAPYLEDLHRQEDHLLADHTSRRLRRTNQDQKSR